MIGAMAHFPNALRLAPALLLLAACTVTTGPASQPPAAPATPVAAAPDPNACASDADCTYTQTAMNGGNCCPVCPQAITVSAKSSSDAQCSGAGGPQPMKCAAVPRCGAPPAIKCNAGHCVNTAI